MIEEEPSTGQPSRGDLGESNLYVNAQATGVHAGKNTAHAVFFFWTRTGPPSKYQSPLFNPRTN